MPSRWFLFPLAVLLGAGVMGAAVAAFALLLIYPNLPSIEALTDYRPKVPLRVYSADGVLIGEFGEERRSVVRIRDVPDVLKHAILAAEDERFYQHTGVDYLGVLRAAYSNLVQGGKLQGASTITMQVARNFFLSREKTVIRKLYEVLLAFKIEASLGKDQILEIYVNQIYLGQRAYGFAAAAQFYFGKSLDRLSAAEAAVLAGLPKAPSAYNPVTNPTRAKQRQGSVLRRMRELGYLNEAQLSQAQKAEIAVRREASDYPVRADYVAEMVRQVIHERYPNDVYSRGFRVYTTIQSNDQKAAYAAVRKGLLDYDQRRGYRGPEAYVELKDTSEDALEDALQDHPDGDELHAAVVLSVDAKSVTAWRRGGQTLTISGEGLKFASRMLEERTPPNRRIRRGSIVRVTQDEKKRWTIVQLPEAESALVSLNSYDGSVRALVGGFDFNRSKYNHVTQAWRQPGSAFKPFIYSAALEKGFTPATIVNDAPVSVDPFLTGGQVWDPHNYDGKYDGPISVRTALEKSKNMVSIRILQAIGTQYAQDYLKRFGFDAEKHPPYLTMALGAGSVTPWQMARGYLVFATGGYRVEPYLIQRIVDDRGNLLAQAQPVPAGDESRRVLDARNAFLMDSLLHDVVRRGTAARAMSLGRQDLGGKTGTTNDMVDAWFCGYQPGIVAVAWVGYDQPRKLGSNETGAVAALPIWMSYMRKALEGVPEVFMPVPPGIVSARVNSQGLRAADGRPEYFYQENLPPELGASEAAARAREEVSNQLF
ncbi:MAG: penicillin-binding protein 1A [Burkholderiales bacterium]|nr:penicillin-binding protein 1A [Burkholderiales bacterium]